VETIATVETWSIQTLQKEWHLYLDCSKLILSWCLKKWKENLFVADDDIRKCWWDGKDPENPPVIKTVKVADGKYMQELYGSCSNSITQRVN
jgi:hypothetical protein